MGRLEGDEGRCGASAAVRHTLASFGSNRMNWLFHCVDHGSRLLEYVNSAPTHFRIINCSLPGVLEVFESYSSTSWIGIAVT